MLCVRETPLHLGHLRLMTQAAEIGAVIMPPVPAFYHRPQSLDDVINQTVNRVLDQFAITLPEDLFARWQAHNSAVALFQGNFDRDQILDILFLPFNRNAAIQPLYLLSSTSGQ